MSSFIKASSPPVRMTEETKEKLQKLQLLLDAGVLTQTDYEAKKLEVEEKSKPEVPQIPSAAEQLGAAPHIAPHLTEETSDGVRVNAISLLNEYFQHIKEDTPETTVRVIPPAGMRPPLVTCTVKCKVAGKEFTESLIGPNKKLVRNEIAMSLLRQLLPDYETPEDIMITIKGMSSTHRQPPKRPSSRAVLDRPREFNAGHGCIESSVGKIGATLPVVCGDADDASRLLQMYCEVHHVMVPNLVTQVISNRARVAATMDLVVKDDTYSVKVEESDLSAARQEACLQVLKQVFPAASTKPAIRTEVERLLTDEQKKKRQKTEPSKPVYLPPTSVAATLLSFYCQTMKVPMPELDKENRLNLTLSDGTHYSVEACKMNKKIARAEACLRLIKLIFPDKDLEQIQTSITELRQKNKEAEKEAARASKPPPQPPRRPGAPRRFPATAMPMILRGPRGVSVLPPTLPVHRGLGIPAHQFAALPAPYFVPAVPYAGAVALPTLPGMP